MPEHRRVSGSTRAVISAFSPLGVLQRSHGPQSILPVAGSSGEGSRSVRKYTRRGPPADDTVRGIARALPRSTVKPRLVLLRIWAKSVGRASRNRPGVVLACRERLTI
jgi:hypothetical protein